MQATFEPTGTAIPRRASCLSSWRASGLSACFSCFGPCAIAARLFWLQVVRHGEFVERAQKQQQRTFEVAPRRGVLYDRNLRELAMTVQVDSIYAVPPRLTTRKPPPHALAAIVHTDPDDTHTTEDEIAARLDDGHSFAWVARRVTPEVAARVKALNIKGIYFQKEFQRFYPDNQIAAQVLGYVGLDDNGLGGLEAEVRRAAARRAGPHVHRHGRAPPGARLHRARAGAGPESGSSPSTRTFSSWPSGAGSRHGEDPGGQRHRGGAGRAHRRRFSRSPSAPPSTPTTSATPRRRCCKNHAVSDVYEPGSVFKLVTYSAALEQHVTTPDDMIDCQGGKITLAGRIIHDNKGEHFGVIPVHKALEDSSDVAAVKLALKVGPDNFYKYIRDFGFGSRTGAGIARRNARPVACPEQVETARPSAPSPSGRKSASRRCNLSPWFPPSPTAAFICRRTC